MQRIAGEIILEHETYLSLTDPIEKFIGRIEHLEKRYKGIKHADMWLVPREELIAVRDELRQPGLRMVENK